MTSAKDVERIIIRNKLLGRWAAGKLGFFSQDMEAYSDALAMAAFDPKQADVFTKIRQDFDAAGVVQSDEDILRVMTELMIQAGNLITGARGDPTDAATVALARNLMRR